MKVLPVHVSVKAVVVKQDLKLPFVHDFVLQKQCLENLYVSN